MPFHGAPHKLFDIGVVAATEAEEADFLETAVGDHLVDCLQDLLQGPLTHGAEDHAGLAEAAAARAAAHDLDGGAVVDDVDEGHDEFGNRRRHDGHHPLHYGGGGVGVGRADLGDGTVGGVAGLVERGDVYAGNACEHSPELAAGLRRLLRVTVELLFPFLMHVDDFEDHLFAFADDHGIEECAHRFRVEAARAAGYHQRVGGVAIGGAQGNLRQVEHGEDIGIELLIGEREGKDVELGGRVACFEPEKGDSIAAHYGLEVAPRTVDALGQEVVPFVDQVVEDHQPQVGPAQFINIGEGEGDLAADGGGVPVFGDAVEFAAGVAGWLHHFVQDAVQGARNLLRRGKHILSLLVFRPAVPLV